jgi:hypothetical protein
MLSYGRRGLTKDIISKAKSKAANQGNQTLVAVLEEALKPKSRQRADPQKEPTLTQ